MNFIESLLGIAPDAGSGLTEVALLAAIFVVALLIIGQHARLPGSTRLKPTKR